MNTAKLMSWLKIHNAASMTTGFVFVYRVSTASCWWAIISITIRMNNVPVAHLLHDYKIPCNYFKEDTKRFAIIFKIALFYYALKKVKQDDALIFACFSYSGAVLWQITNQTGRKLVGTWSPCTKHIKTCMTIRPQLSPAVADIPTNTHTKELFIHWVKD